MSIPFHFHTILIGVVIAQGLFAAGILFLRPANKKANRILSLLVVLFSMWLLDTFFRVSGIYDQNPNYYFLPIYYSLGFGPLIYFYSRAMTEEGFTFQKKDWWHFVPVLFQGLSYVILQGQSYEVRRWFWTAVHRPYTYDLEFHLSLVSILVYLWFSFQVIKKYQHWINNQFSEVSKINLQWLKLVLVVVFGVAILWLIDDILRETFAYYPDQTYSAMAMGISILILAGGGILQEGLKGQRQHTTSEEEAKPTLETEPIDPTKLKHIITVMEQKLCYLDKDLHLKSFATDVQLSPRQVSHHINQGLGVSFIDFVNEYRVKQVQQHLKNHTYPHLTLLGIAYESGFSSKSTFNRVFKKVTGKSPSAYQRALNK